MADNTTTNGHGNGHAADHGHGGGHGSHHIIPLPTLYKTFAILILGMILTVVAARLPYWLGIEDQVPQVVANVIALTIAFVKAAYVVQIFMGVKYTTKLVKLYAYGGFIWFLTMGFAMIDYFTRPWEPVRGWENTQDSALNRGETTFR